MNDEDMDTYVFAVGTRKALVRLQKEMQDLVCMAWQVVHRTTHLTSVVLVFLFQSHQFSYRYGCNHCAPWLTEHISAYSTC